MKRRCKNGFRLKQFLLACGMLVFVAVFVTVVMRGDLERRKVASCVDGVGRVSLSCGLEGEGHNF